jgi:hypothetical protein
MFPPSGEAAGTGDIPDNEMAVAQAMHMRCSAMHFRIPGLGENTQTLKVLLVKEVTCVNGFREHWHK